MTHRISWFPAVLALAGCASETGGVRLVVHTDVDVPSGMDAVKVRIFAGAEGTAPYDEERTFAAGGPGDFPITVALRPVAALGDRVMFRARGLLGTDVVVERWAAAEFVEGEMVEVEVLLETSCLDRDCDPGRECRAGACLDAARPPGWTAGCGDGVPDAGEECDEGADNDDGAPDRCRTDCRVARCGDGVGDTGEECDDGDETPGDGCEGDCRFSCHAAPDCDDSNECTADECDAGGGGRTCGHVVREGEECDDGDECTAGSTCDAGGGCAGGTPSCECASDPDCAVHEDGDPCNGTLGCVATHRCVLDPATILDPGAPCDDGLWCNGADACSADRRCDHAGDPCASCQTCDETAGECSLEPGFCLIGGECRSDGDDNPAEGCEECVTAASTGAWTDKTDGEACDDGNDCTAGETCGGGECAGGTPSCECERTSDCAAREDGNPCNGTLRCDATHHCVVDPATVRAPGAACDDGSFCNGADVCDAEPPATRACSHPGDPCAPCRICDEIADRCDVAAGSCWIDGACWADGAVDPANPCRTCAAGTNPTSWTDAPAGTPCDDGDGCSHDDRCAGGACAGVSGCTASPLVFADRSVRLCIADADCDGLGAGACTTVNAPSSWTAWDPDSNAMAHCTGFWVLGVTPLAPGEHCYRFRPNSGPTWYLDPLNPDSGAGRCGGDNSRITIP